MRIPPELVEISAADDGVGGEFLFMWQWRYFSGKQDCAGFVLTCSDSEVQVIDNSTTVLDGQAPQVTD